MAYYIGTAGWTIRPEHRRAFPEEGTHLARYAARLPAVEINSSFYASHRASTYARWGHTVPESFRFAVKMPKAITHEHRLIDADHLLEAFLSEIACLGPRLGCVLVQLPPSLAFDMRTAAAFLALLRSRHDGPVALEPRHPSWFESLPNELLCVHQVTRAAADPILTECAAERGGWPGGSYFRLHGSPRMYYSAYGAEYLDELAERLRRTRNDVDHVWCIFDNTALGHATANALGLLQRLM